MKTSNVARAVAVYPAAVAVALAASTVAAAAPASVPAGTLNGCPHDVLPLPGLLASYAPTVRRVVLRFVATTFARRSKTPQQLAAARIRQIILVRHWFPSGWIKSECGNAVWQNSVALDVYFPRLDKPHNPVGHCNACDHITFITSRTSGGWTVWGIY